MIIDVYDHEIPFLEGDCRKYIGIIHIDGMFFFGSASTVLARSESLLEKETVIIDCQKVKSLDISATYTLEKMISNLKERNIHVIVVFNNVKLAMDQYQRGLYPLLTRHDTTLSVKRAVEKAIRFHNLHTK